MQLARDPNGQAAVLGIDIGSSYIKAHVLAVYVKQGQVKFHDKGSPYTDLKPRPSTVNGNQSSLQRWRNTRSGQIKNRLTYGRSTSKQYFQLVNPKRCFLVQHSEVDAGKLARDTGLPTEAAVSSGDGFISMEVSPGTVISMDEVFGAMIHDIFVDLHRSGHYSSIQAVAVTLPNTISRAGRTRAWSIIKQQLDFFSSEQKFSILRHNVRPPYIGIIPEGVAVARELCSSELIGQEGPVRVMTVDSGHSTLDVSQMTVKQVDGALDISDVINTGNAFCGVKDVALALLGKLPAAVLQQVAQAADTSGSLYGVNEILDYIDEMVVGGSQPNLAATDRIASSSAPPHLPEQAPVTCGDVAEASKVLSEPGDKVVRRNLLLGKLCGHPPPAVVLMTGGGGMVPALKDAVMSAVGPNTRIVPSSGGNRQPVARGAALLLVDGLQRHHNQQLQQHKNGSRTTATSGTGDQQGPYLQLLPDYWASPLGCSIGVWSAFSTAHVDGITDVQQLENLKQRLTAAALQEGASAAAAPEPDVATRNRHQQQMLDYINYRVAVLQQQQQPPAPRGRGRPRKAPQRPKPPNLDREIFFYYSLLLPDSTVPGEPAKLPWQLCKPADGDTLRVQLVRLDPLGVEAETFAGDYLVPAPDAVHCVQLSVAVDEHGMIVCQAHLKHRADSDDLPGQPLNVQTNHDRYAAQRRDRQQRVHQLPLHVQEFLQQLNGEEAAAVAPAAAATAPQAAATQPAAAAASSLHQAASPQHQHQQNDAVAASVDSLLAAAKHAADIESELQLVHPLQHTPPSPQQQAAGSNKPVQVLPVDATVSRLQLLAARNCIGSAAVTPVTGNNNQADHLTAKTSLVVEAQAKVAAAFGAADDCGGANNSGSAEIPYIGLAAAGAAADAADSNALDANGAAAEHAKGPTVASASATVVTNVSSMTNSRKKRKRAQAPSSVVTEAVAAKQYRVTRSSLARPAQQ